MATKYNVIGKNFVSENGQIFRNNITGNTDQDQLEVRLSLADSMICDLLLLGSQMLMDPELIQQHAGLQHAVFQPQQEVNKPKARFKPVFPGKSDVNREQLPRCLFCGSHGDLV